MMAPRTVTESIGGFVSRAAPSGAPTSTGYTDGPATQTQPCHVVQVYGAASPRRLRPPAAPCPGPQGLAAECAGQPVPANFRTCPNPAARDCRGVLRGERGIVVWYFGG